MVFFTNNTIFAPNGPLEAGAEESTELTSDAVWESISVSFTGPDDSCAESGRSVAVSLLLSSVCSWLARPAKVIECVYPLLLVS